MISYLKPILASGFAALLVAATPAFGSTPPQAQAVEQTNDSAITAKVKAAIAADTLLEGAMISIQTAQGEVHLSGIVGSPADIQKAADIAMSVPGVKSVKNALKSQ